MRREESFQLREVDWPGALVDLNRVSSTHGDVGAAFSGDVDEFVLHTFAEVEIVNRLLPCGAEYISATQRGPYINALFKLTNRTGPGGGPSLAGGLYRPGPIRT